MSTVTMNISMPPALKTFVDERVAGRGYGSYSEYVRDLVRKDEIEAAKEKLRGLIFEGMNSGEGKPWDEFRSELRERANQPVV